MGNPVYSVGCVESSGVFSGLYGGIKYSMCGECVHYCLARD
jgi:hypothetical protein